MATTFKQCPKCGHVRKPGEDAAPERCPSCGLYFAKWAARDAFVPPSQAKRAAASGGEGRTGGRWHDPLRERLLHVPADVTGLHLAWRAAALLLLAVWGVRIGLMDYRDGEVGTSFMHNILLPIHEAGHVLFMPFGEFMSILGGSLFQLLLPLFVAGALLWSNRDAFGCAIGLWWASVSLIDLAPYIYDAKRPQLILLTGTTGEDGPHDWIYLLGRFGHVHHSQAYGALAHHLGFAMMLLSLGFAAWALWRWHGARRDFPV